uniref:Ubiquitin-like protease family profile domain-containing protein n=1 Tax=Brassica oleracea var. oleracea TaxID=109376 RepID=A0A0D3CP38_BRAOL
MVSLETISSPTKNYSDDFLEVFQSVRLCRRLTGSLPDDLSLRWKSSRVPENGFTSTPTEDIYIRGRAPAPKSILYHTDDSNLFTALTLVHYKLGFQLNIKKKYELWSLVGPEPVRFSLLEFEHLTGLNCDYIEDLENPRCEIIAAFGRCEEWSRDDRMRLGYLAIFTGFIEGRKGPAAENIIKVMFNAKANWKWTMDCWEVTSTNLSVKKEVSAAETESGVKEESARPRKKARKEVRKEAFVDASKVPSTEARSEASVEKKVGITKKGTASNELQITTSSPPKRGHEPGSESVNGAKAGQNDPQEPSSLKDLSLVIANEPEGKPTEQSGEPSVLVLDKGVPTDSDLQKGETRRQRTKDAAMVHVRGKSDRARKLAASQQSPFKGNNTAKVIIPNKRVGQGYDHFAPFDKKMSKVFTDWVKLDTYFKTPMDKKPRRFPSRFYHTLRTPIEWLNDGVSLLLCLLVSHLPVVMSSLEDLTDNLPISLLWSHKYPEFKSDEGDINCLGRRLPCGAWNYHAGIVPTFCQSMKVWGLDVDDIYAPVNFRNEHWIAMWILIPKKHIVVWDNIISHIRAAELDVVMEPFVTMVPYLLVECAGSDEDRVQHTLEPYTYERVIVGVPQC